MRNMSLFSVMAFLFLSSIFNPASAFTEIVNREELKSRLGSLPTANNLGDIKIAVLDNSFGGFVPGKGMLPESAELIEGPLKYPATSAHGLGMAQIIWAMTGQLAEGPKIYLVDSNGFTNFKAAVDFVIANDIDIVLYSQVWLFGSNFDGKGFINAEVNRATEKGIIWINAAGNLGGHVYSSGVSSSKSFKLVNRLDENSFTVTLAWNDFFESELECTKKDLGIEILNAKGKVVASADLIQEGRGPDPKDPKDRHSCYARESLSIPSLERGNYQIRVVAKTQNFGPTDRFKVIVNDERPGSLDFPDHAVGFEIMPPADNASVITIGDQSALSSVGPTADGRIKPDFVVENSKVAFTNGNLTQGSSNAAAMVAGSVAVIKALKGTLTAQELLSYAESLRQEYVIPNGLITPLTVPFILRQYIPADGAIRAHPLTGRAIIFSKEDPRELSMLKHFNLPFIRPDDIIACDEFLRTCGLYPRSQDLLLTPPMVEFRQFLRGAKNSKIGTWNSLRVL